MNHKGYFGTMTAIAKLGLAMIPQLASSSSSTSTAVAMATAAALGQGFSQGWTTQSRLVHAREYTVKPYFARERPSGTKLETTYTPDGSIAGLRYVKTYPVPPRNLAVIYAPRFLMFALAKSVFLQAAVTVMRNVSLMEAAERRAMEAGEESPEFVVIPAEEVRPIIRRSSIMFIRDIAVQTVRHIMDIYAGHKLTPQLAWKLRKGFKLSAVRKRYLPWHQRLTRTTKTVFVSSILSSLADWAVNSTVDIYRMCHAAKTSRHHKERLLRRLLLRMFGNAVKAGACLVGAAVGAGAASVIWPGGGTLIGYNVADILISIFLIGPFTEKYISMEPPPAAFDAGQLERDPPMHGPQIIDRATGEVRELDGSSDDDLVDGHRHTRSTEQRLNSMQDLD